MPHTSGPWHRNIKPASHYPTIWSGLNRHVAYVTPQGLPEEEVEANIDLIAAAPDLLEALETMLSEYEGYSDGWEPDSEAHAICNAARAAIAKAKGAEGGKDSEEPRRA